VFAATFRQIMPRLIATFPILLLSAYATCLSAQNEAPGQDAPASTTLPGWQWDFTGAVNISGLDSLRKKVLASGNANADETIYQDFCQQADTLHFNLSNETFLRKYIADAEVLQHAQYYRPENSLLFEAMSDYMLDNLADTLKYAINANLVDKQEPSVIYLVQRLADNRMFIDIRVSNWKKILTYLLEGRFGYVFHKLTTTYLPEFLKFLSVLSLLTLLFFQRKRMVNLIKKQPDRT